MAQRIGAVQAGVVADHSALRRGFDIGGHPALDEIADFEDALVNLLTDLQRIAAIDEDGGAIREDHGRAGRAGEAGGPGEAVVGLRQVFVLVLVLMRNEKAIEALGLHGLTDQRNVAGPNEGSVDSSKVWRMGATYSSSSVRATAGNGLITGAAQPVGICINPAEPP